MMTQHAARGCAVRGFGDVHRGNRLIPEPDGNRSIPREES